MSPSRRDLIKSAAALSALLSTSQVSGAIAAENVAPVATGAHGDGRICDIRKAEIFGVVRNFETGEQHVCTLFLDGDLDETWTVYAAPHWRKDASTEGDDNTGYHVTRDHTADSLMAAVWDSLFAPAPRVVAATPFHDFAEVRDAHDAVWQRDWMRQAAEGTWLDQYGWKSVDQINASDMEWNLVTNRADVMAEFPGYGAIIMCMGRFYLAVLEGGAR